MRQSSLFRGYKTASPHHTLYEFSFQAFHFKRNGFFLPKTDNLC